MELSKQVNEFGKTCEGLEQYSVQRFAKALQVITFIALRLPCYSECLKSELVWISDSLVVSHYQTIPISDTFFCLKLGPKILRHQPRSFNVKKNIFKTLNSQNNLAQFAQILDSLAVPIWNINHATLSDIGTVKCPDFGTV